MVKRTCSILVVFVIFALLAGCISTEMKLSANDNNRQIELNKGQMLIINLEANPSTGYTWDIAELDENVLRKIGETEFQPESTAVGAKGIQTLRFQALNAGRTNLKLVYHRPWEKDVEPLENFSIQVTVR